jgi:hypothetical protein
MTRIRMAQNPMTRNPMTRNPMTRNRMSQSRMASPIVNAMPNASCSRPV